MIKYILLLAALFLPFSVNASVVLANCDKEPHDVIVSNSGSERVVTLQESGEIEEFGPISAISFQIKDKSGKQPRFIPTAPYEEFCIWSNKISVQRYNRGGEGSGGF